MDPVYLRLLGYALSFLFGLIPAAMAGYVAYDATADILTNHPQGLVVALISSGAITTGIFAKWGKK